MSCRNTIVYACSVIFFLFISVLPVSAQSSSSGPIRVHILPTINQTGRSELDAVAGAVTSTVRLTLRLLGRYDISTDERRGTQTGPALPTDPEDRVTVLAELAETLAVENIVFGEVLPGEPAPEITLAVYDRLRGEITFQERRRPDSLFGVFSATDELAAAVLTGFSGRRIAFGSIRIEPTDVSSTPPDYRVILDDEELGRNLRSIDSILTGEHRLTVVAEILGDEEVLIDRPITVGEDATAVVSVEFPDISSLTETAKIERRRAEERLDVALREIEEAREALEEKVFFTRSWQRQHDEIDLAEGYYLTADEYIDPQRVREAAISIPSTLAAGRIDTGRSYLSRREYDEGIEIIRTIPEFATRFDQTDLYGYRDEVGFVQYNWNEYEVQRERKPTVWVPIALLAAAMPLSGQYWNPVFLESGVAMKDGAFMVPILFGAAFTGLWNAIDWDYIGHRRELRRYGEENEAPLRDELTPWPPGKWELAAGARAFSLSKNWIDDYGVNDAYDGRSIARLVHAGLSPSLAIRRWVNQHNAVGINLMPGMVPFNSGIYITTNYADGPNGDGPGIENSSLGSVEVDWTYTRTGRGYLRGGVGLTMIRSDIEDLESNDSDGAVPPDTVAEEVLYANSGGTAITMFGLTLGTGFRFGRRPDLPWTLGIGYRLEMLTLGEGTAADYAPYFAHTTYAQLTRSWGIGEPKSTERSVYREFSDRESARELTEKRWVGLPVTVRADGGGAIAYGPFIGAEYHVTDLWSVGLHGRLGFGAVSNAKKYWYDTYAFVPMYPGLSVRRYFRPQRTGPELRGMYVGVVAEYIDFAQGGDSAGFYSSDLQGDDIGYRYQEGNLWVVQAEIGYRVPVWRSAFIEIGGQIGRSFGAGFYSAADTISPDGSLRRDDEYESGTGWWFNPVLALGTRLY